MFDQTEREADVAALSVRFLHIVAVMEACSHEPDDYIEELRRAKVAELMVLSEEDRPSPTLHLAD